MASIDRCIVCQVAASARCSGCKRVLFCGARCQKLLWPVHKTQCGTGVDYFRAAPLSAAEVKTLDLIDKHNQGRASYPFSREKYTLREALHRFGVADSLSVNDLLAPLQAKSLDLKQSKLVLLFRFYLRSYRYEDGFTAFCGRDLEGHLTITAHHYSALWTFPLIVSTPHGNERYFRLPPGQTEALIYARDFCDQVSVYTTLSLIGGGLQHSIERGLSTAVSEQDEIMRWHTRVIEHCFDLWQTFDLHPMMEDAGPTHWERGIYREEADLADDNSFFLLPATGLLV